MTGFARHAEDRPFREDEYATAKTIAAAASATTLDGKAEAASGDVLIECLCGCFDVGEHNRRVRAVWEGEEQAAFAGLDDLIEHYKRGARLAAERRGWLTGHINQTDAWFRDERTPEERIGGGA